MTEYLPYKFTEQELRDIAEGLAQGVQNLQSLEERKKQVVSDFKAKVDTEAANVNMLSRKMSQKYEYRDIECEKVIDMPQRGMKTIVRKDTGETVKVEQMSAAELQQSLDFDAKPTPVPPAPEPEPYVRPIAALIEGSAEQPGVEPNAPIEATFVQSEGEAEPEANSDDFTDLSVNIDEVGEGPLF